MLFGKEHVDRYRATDGEEGHIWEKGSTVALLTTTGRKSGEERTTPLIYGETPEGDHMVVASNGGQDSRPPGGSTSRRTRRPSSRSRRTASRSRPARRARTRSRSSGSR